MIQVETVPSFALIADSPACFLPICIEAEMILTTANGTRLVLRVLLFYIRENNAID